MHAVRRDVADVELADRVFAPHYARATRCHCVAAAAMLRQDPHAGARAVSQLLRGEEFAVLDVAGGWAWGYCGHDRYVGYVAADALGKLAEPTHVVAGSGALVFEEADIKSRAVADWPVGARFRGELRDGFIAAEEGFVHVRHARALHAFDSDAAAVAERLVGLTYLWGGRGGGGIDCSGLVQLSLALCGTAAPRDSDQQRALGREIGRDEPLRRGDLIFLPSHVGMMADGNRLIHANAFWMAVTVEPLAQVTARLADRHAEPILARRRID